MRPPALFRAAVCAPVRARFRALLCAGAIVGVCAGVLGACALFSEPSSDATPSGNAPADRARLVVYRAAPNHLLGRLTDHEVTIDGAPTCALANGGFFVRELPPGDTIIAVGTSRLALATQAGQAYFVRLAFNDRRASLLGWIPPVLGFAPDAQTPDSGLFAITTIDAASATPEIARLTRDPDCP